MSIYTLLKASLCSCRSPSIPFIASIKARYSWKTWNYWSKLITFAFEDNLGWFNIFGNSLSESFLNTNSCLWYCKLLFYSVLTYWRTFVNNVLCNLFLVILKTEILEDILTRLHFAWAHVLVFSCCYNKLSWTWCLMTTQIYFIFLTQNLLG